MTGNKYLDFSKKFKVLSDPKRLEIIDLLSCRELCACEILEYFDISQPTLSSDMKKLEDGGLVTSRREGKKIFYRLNLENFESLEAFLKDISTPSEDCICNKGKK